MTKHMVHADTGHMLGSVGWFLMLVVAWLAGRGYGPEQTLAARLAGAMARRAIDAIAAVGWLADRLPRPTSHRPGSSSATGAAAAGRGLGAFGTRGTTQI